MRVSARTKRGRTSVRKTPRSSGVIVRMSAADVLGVTANQLIDKIHIGLRYSFAKRLIDVLAIQENELAVHLNIPSRTWARRKAEGSLDPIESDRLARLALLFAEAVNLFLGDAKKAAEWLKSPKPALSGLTPLDRADTEIGLEEVRDLIHQLQQGVYV